MIKFTFKIGGLYYEIICDNHCVGTYNGQDIDSNEDLDLEKYVFIKYNDNSKGFNSLYIVKNSGVDNNDSLWGSWADIAGPWIPRPNLRARFSTGFYFHPSVITNVEEVDHV